jgi:hypothetical protein
MTSVGPDYGHAEARKSPTIDGKVERDSDGKEVRFPGEFYVFRILGRSMLFSSHAMIVILNYREKEIARRIVVGFKQWICGFDILRVQEGNAVMSFVCDVNGWSFVKNSRCVAFMMLSNAAAANFFSTESTTMIAPKSCRSIFWPRSSQKLLRPFRRSILW